MLRVELNRNITIQPIVAAQYTAVSFEKREKSLAAIPNSKTDVGAQFIALPHHVVGQDLSRLGGYRRART